MNIIVNAGKVVNLKVISVTCRYREKHATIYFLFGGLPFGNAVNLLSRSPSMFFIKDSQGESNLSFSSRKIPIKMLVSRPTRFTASILLSVPSEEIQNPF